MITPGWPQRPHVSRSSSDKNAIPKKAPNPVDSHRQPSAHAPENACNEPGETGQGARPDLPANTEIRKGREPDRRKPVAANFSNLAGPGRVFLRRCPGRIGNIRVG